MASHHATGRVRELSDLRRRLVPLFLRGLEHEDVSHLRTTLSVAASGRLNDRLQARLGAPDHPKIQVDAGLDQGRCDQSYGSSIPQPLAYVIELFPAVAGAHQRGQVGCALRVRHALVQLPCVAECVDDAKGLRRLVQPLRQRGTVQLPLMAYPRAFERPIQAFRLRSQFPRVFETARKPIRLRQRGLGGGAQHDARSPVSRQLVERGHTGTQVLERERLCLVQNDHAVRDVVQLSAARRPVAEQAFEELHGGGDDDRRVPVLHRQPQLVPRLPLADSILVERAVMLDHEVRFFCIASPQCVVEHRRRLLDDAHVGNDVDHAGEAMALRVVQGEGERRQRLAAASGYGQRKQARGIHRLAADMSQYLLTQVVHGAGVGVCRELVEVCAQPSLQLGDGRVLPARLRRAFQPPEIIFGVQVVGIHERGEQHPDEESRAESGGIRVARNGVGGRQIGRERDLLLPNRVRRRNFFLETSFEGGGPLTIHSVGKPGVMAGDTERQHLAEVSAVSFHRHLGAGGGVIDTLATARQPILKSLRVLAEIMQQPGHPCEFGPAHCVEKPRGARARVFEVLRQPVPMLPVFRVAAMGVVLRPNHSVSLGFHTSSISFSFVPFALRPDTMS